MTMEPIKHLDDKYCSICNECLQHCRVTQDLIERAKATGIEVEDRLERNQQQQQIAKLFKQNFFPHNL